MRNKARTRCPRRASARLLRVRTAGGSRAVQVARLSWFGLLASCDGTRGALVVSRDQPDAGETASDAGNDAGDGGAVETWRPDESASFQLQLTGELDTSLD